MTREEKYREDVRRVLNQILDEEFDAMMKEVKEGRAVLKDEEITPGTITKLLNLDDKSDEDGEAKV